jgi:hypothetical protein
MKCTCGEHSKCSIPGISVLEDEQDVTTVSTRKTISSAHAAYLPLVIFAKHDSGKEGGISMAGDLPNAFHVYSIGPYDNYL